MANSHPPLKPFEPFGKQRAAGVLLAVSSLPSPYGIGAFGKAAHDFVDFLAAAGQSYWQLLPLSPTGFADSPYQSFSAFAGNPYFIDLDLLCDEGLLQTTECETVFWGDDPALVDYGALFTGRARVLRKAFHRFTPNAAYEAFLAANAHWLDDYALFMALKNRFGLRPWAAWPDGARLREAAVLAKLQTELKEDTAFHRFIQYQFFTQWAALKQYANAHGVRVIGDIPIYVAMDSADTWAHPELFYLDADRRPIDVAGVPPDPFSQTGQLWGNPLYRWEEMHQNGYAWWMQRLTANLGLYDVLRIDHFRGFESYYAISATAKTAATGQWRKGPGMHFINAVNAAFPHAAIIAEDLGFLTENVRALQTASGYPGMKILQFAFDSREDSDYLPHSYEKNCVAYTGTHDNDTTAGWFTSALPEDIAFAREYLGIGGCATAEEGAKAFLRTVLASVAATAIVPMQDWLLLGSEARMNTPATIGGKNWRWRMPPSGTGAHDSIACADMSALSEKIKRMSAIYGRV